MQRIASKCSAPPAPTLVPLGEALRSRGVKVHYTTWLRFVRTKGLPAKKIGGRYYIALDELDRWISEQSVGPRRPPCDSPKAMQSAAADAVLAARRPTRRPLGERSQGGRA